MSEFEFYFSFYGLLLGLSAAEVANGLATSISSRRAVVMGVLTPMLALFVLLDISSFWMWSWATKDSVSISWGLMIGGLIVALTYYLAAALIFPRKAEEWPVLDEHYWEHKKYVVGGLTVSNVLSTGFTIYQHPPAASDTILFVWMVAYWVPLLMLFFTKSARGDLTLLTLLLAQYLASASGMFPNSNWGNSVGL
jgi:MFS family permease